MNKRWRTLIIVAALGTASAGLGVYQYDRSHVRVIDGDTVRFGKWWPETVRIAGIDAPEIRGARCDEELVFGKTMRQAAVRLVRDGAAVSRRHGTDFYGRTIGDVQLDDGRDLAQTLLTYSLVRACEPPCSRRDATWCRSTTTEHIIP